MKRGRTADLGYALLLSAPILIFLLQLALPIPVAVFPSYWIPLLLAPAFATPAQILQLTALIAGLGIIEGIHDSALLKLDHWYRMAPLMSVSLLAYWLATQRQRDRVLRQSADQRYRLLAENSADVVFQGNREMRFEWVSPSVHSLLGFKAVWMVGRRFNEFILPDDRWRMEAIILQVRQGVPACFEARFLKARGGSRWLSVTTRPLFDADGVVSGWVGRWHDIQPEIDGRLRLVRAEHRDPLTGLATRASTLAALQKALDQHGESLVILAVLNIGLDGLTRVNDALTHAAGDQLITTIAARITRAVGSSGRVGRSTGDEFIVVLPGLSSGVDASLAADRIRLACQGAVVLDDTRIDPTVSIGIATGRQGDDSHDLLRDASLAMRLAKADGRDRHAFVDAELAGAARRELTLQDEIRVGLAEQEFVAWFMPIVSLETDAVVGYEALVRWLRADGKTIDPGIFLPIADRSHQITLIDASVLAQAIAALARLHESISIAVNVSARSLLRNDYATAVAETLAAADVTPSRLHLEITETAVLRITEPIQMSILQLAALGVRWYVDDFGTGYSSISHLRDLPIAGLKLDRSITTGLAAGHFKSVRLAKALLGVAEGLEIDSVAEGVETPIEAALLNAQGWKHGQGLLFGAAMPLALIPAERRARPA